MRDRLMKTIGPAALVLLFAGMTFALPRPIKINPVDNREDDSRKSELRYDRNDIDSRRAWLGVSIDKLDDDVAGRLGIEGTHGIEVDRVVDDSPADKAGVRDGDVILKFNGDKVFTVNQLIEMVRSQSPGDDFSILINRDGDEKTLSGELTQTQIRAPRAPRADFRRDRADYKRELNDFRKKARKERTRKHYRADKRKHSKERGNWRSFAGLGDSESNLGNSYSLFSSVYIGVKLQKVSGQLAEYFGLDDRDGALITEVMEDTPAEKAGLKAGDVITSAGGDEVESVGDIQEIISEQDEGETVDITVIRNKSERIFQVEVAERDESFGFLGGEGRAFSFNFDDDSPVIAAPRIGHPKKFIGKLFNKVTPLLGLGENARWKSEFERELRELRRELKELDEERSADLRRELEELKKAIQELQKEG
ncbi:MAG: PDZ domain-containing protein [candidate division Zixibacteria bacterium]|nr:PDZ domain-containing protein [candidate division Zixibacteria bacterium]